MKAVVRWFGIVVCVPQQRVFGSSQKPNIEPELDNVQKAFGIGNVPQCDTPLILRCHTITVGPRYIVVGALLDPVLPKVLLYGKESHNIDC